MGAASGGGPKTATPPMAVPSRLVFACSLACGASLSDLRGLSDPTLLWPAVFLKVDTLIIREVLFAAGV